MKGQLPERLGMKEGGVEPCYSKTDAGIKKGTDYQKNRFSESNTDADDIEQDLERFADLLIDETTDLYYRRIARKQNVIANQKIKKYGIQTATRKKSEELHGLDKNSGGLGQLKTDSFFKGLVCNPEKNITIPELVSSHCEIDTNYMYYNVKNSIPEKLQGHAHWKRDIKLENETERYGLDEIPYGYKNKKSFENNDKNLIESANAYKSSEQENEHVGTHAGGMEKEIYNYVLLDDGLLIPDSEISFSQMVQAQSLQKSQDGETGRSKIAYTDMPVLEREIDFSRVNKINVCDMPEIHKHDTITKNFISDRQTVNKEQENKPNSSKETSNQYGKTSQLNVKEHSNDKQNMLENKSESCEKECVQTFKETKRNSSCQIDVETIGNNVSLIDSVIVPSWKNIFDIMNATEREIKLNAKHVFSATLCKRKLMPFINFVTALGEPCCRHLQAGALLDSALTEITYADSMKWGNAAINLLIGLPSLENRKSVIWKVFELYLEMISKRRSSWPCTDTAVANRYDTKVEDWFSDTFPALCCGTQILDKHCDSDRENLVSVIMNGPVLEHNPTVVEFQHTKSSESPSKSNTSNDSILDNVVDKIHTVSIENDSTDAVVRDSETSFNMKFLEFIGKTPNRLKDETKQTEVFDSRVKERKTYLDQDLDDDEIDGKRNYSIEEKLASNKYNKTFVKTDLLGEDFNLRYLQEHGLTQPIYFKEKTGLGLRVPSENFQVSDVKACVGSRRVLDVMDVTTQKGMEMTMKEWTKYYENKDRDKLLNVISLEFSHTKLENYVESPALVREIDWVDIAWPQHLKDCQTESTNVIDKMKYPKVQKYCLMSVRGCYTDFHIDFGGTSVWYHILHGEKVFWLIPPTPKNMSTYENWVLSAKQGDVFLGDVITDCQKMTLTAGSTFIIPSGWIHAVYTPKDSLVFGGNFLHSFSIDKQLGVAAIEEKTHVPGKFRYPFYAEIGWYVIERYVHCITGQTYLEKPKLSDDLELQMSGMATSPESPLMDDIKVETPKQEQEVLTPKLPKRVAVTLTRIDNAYSQSPRRQSSSDDDSMASGPPRSPLEVADGHRLYRKSSTESSTSVPDSNSNVDSKQNKIVPSIHGDKPKGRDGASGKKKMKNVLLTKYEKIGLTKLVQWIEDLPPSKKGVPKDLLNPEAVLREIKHILEEHMNDSEKMAATGEPILVWTKATKKLIKMKQKAKLMGVSKGTGKASKGSGDRHRRVRCKKCEPCTRDDCRECNFCKDMKKYGGPGRMKQSCISRQCLAPCLANSAICKLCKEDVHVRDSSGEEMSTLMECGICWEIVHPNCLKTKENLEGEGTINEDLPNSWICIKCNTDGKEKHLKPRVFKGGWRPSPAASPSPVASPNPEIHPGDELVTEGKRVVTKQSADPPKPVIVKASSEGSMTHSNVQLNTPSSQWQKAYEKSMDIKTEVTVVKEEENSEADMEVEDFKPTEKNHYSVKKVVKRKSVATPEGTDAGQKKPRLSLSTSPKAKGKSPKPQKPQPPSRTSSGKKLKKSPLGEVNPHPLEFSPGGRPKREGSNSTQYPDPSTSYEFDDGEPPGNQTIALPHLEKGKGAITKGGRRQKSGKLIHKAVPEVHNVGGGEMVGTSASSLKLDITGSPVKQFSMRKKPGDIGKSLLEHIEKQGLKVVPQKYVVRPLPVSPPKTYTEMTSGEKHPLPITVWTKIFSYLSQADLARCLCVCRVWNRWCINPDLWKEIDLSRNRIVQTHLMGIVRRQPETLILSSVIMTPKQLTWLVERIPLLKKLVLSKCSWVTMSGLCTSACPLLTELDISWATGISDQFFEDIITPPVDRKPAVKNISRLHRLRTLLLGGTEITDHSIELLTMHLSQLEVLDLSYCTKITDTSIEYLTSSKSATLETLKVLNLSGCRQLTEASLYMIKNFKHLSRLNMSGCNKIPADNLRHFRMQGHVQFIR